MSSDVEMDDSSQSETEIGSELAIGSNIVSAGSYAYFFVAVATPQPLY
jgi:hypothetical protein